MHAHMLFLELVFYATAGQSRSFVRSVAYSPLSEPYHPRIPFRAHKITIAAKNDSEMNTARKENENETKRNGKKNGPPRQDRKQQSFAQTRCSSSFSSLCVPHPPFLPLSFSLSLYLVICISLSRSLSLCLALYICPGSSCLYQRNVPVFLSRC